MERVVALCWKPVYKFIRSKFHRDNEAAKDLTQGFFASALGARFLPAIPPVGGRLPHPSPLAVERIDAYRHEADKRQKRGLAALLKQTQKSPTRKRRAVKSSVDGQAIARRQRQ